MDDNWESDNKTSSRRYDRGYDHRRGNRRERGSQFYRRSNRSFGDNNDSNKQSYNNDSYRKSDEKSNSTNGLVMYIDSNNIGRLIGRGGSKIKALQEDSGARINIDKQHNENGQSAVTLTGTDNAQQRAKSLIEELLIERGGTERNNTHENESAQKISQPEEKEEIDWANFDWNKANEEYEERQRQKWAALPPIIKNFYKEDPAIANMPQSVVTHFRKTNNNIEVRHVFENTGGSDENMKIPNPVQTFEQAFHAFPDILKEIRKQNFEKPSPIQCQAWPILLSGQDLIGIAQTGTGKTLAFLLPALIHIDGQVTPRDERSGPNVLVMAPTRELALQIEKEVGKYSYHGIKAVCVYGGGNRKAQIDTVTKGVQIVIATPGRLNDLVQANILDVSAVTYLILDEADRMLDMGFEPQIRKTLLGVRPNRQTIMTSATWPQGVRRLAQSYMKNPIQVFVGSLDLAAVHSVTQRIYMINEDEKIDMMHQFFQEMGPQDKVIVFFGKKSKVDDVSSDLALTNIDCQSIHGDRDQSDREQALEDLKTGAVQILLATDVASRGIDIEDITHVLNYDFPRDIEEYVHRVGRTGRAGRTGESITFMTRQDWHHAKALIDILEEANQEVPEEVYKMAERYDAWKKKKEQEDPYGRGNRGGRRGYRRM
ncbi:putative ATP-dependent RNA helicase DDX43 [Trachymyrmex septentrionalis]|uniref:RNA helicase n=1 Tax=Trachymyrmex septentrionalis TaxID=34720 RepID=A0A195FKQ2_9HYME|nr:PREDICTED: probable ATP-dependent RNA helicase DDX43 [Trachymyrmex septentrionalis]XP_018340229.1 PREDICTED: probable ATP-dependent RNA helicase DDX43 [Trachymyrmex septentrionalis]XP_018340230.1 PREDICTED: probable ATP-dependent RNA helicase DDX43 [Trachymyrmex septentrionalis]XP_018340231.1 PREDICTED: probable ATP-dependent RNA helicase DDX43 [Trachymyrmex septentrionalis]XP_018340232.1 PREDICTED: probable ATP-dependent RNA helicase DDX43 [Trachymyrmex septentrionalis]XP_018340233.1 PREDI